MNYKIPEFLKLCREITVNSRLNDPVRLREVLNRHQARLESRLDENGLGIAMDRLSSYYSNTGRYHELSRGLTYYKFVTGLVNSFDENRDSIIRNLVETAGLLFRKSNLQVAVTAASGDLERFVENTRIYTDALLDGGSDPRKYAFEFNTPNEGITSSSKVQYVVQGFDYRQLGYSYKGQMAVMNQVLSRDYLHEKIRVMGGAYGGFSGLSENGTFYFGSYRDPNLSESLEHYRNAAGFLREFQAGDTAMTRYIIGTLARYERPHTPRMKGDSALENYFENIPEEQVQRIRREILATSAADIRALADMIREITDQNYYCVFGNESRIREAEDIFSRIVPARE